MHRAEGTEHFHSLKTTRWPVVRKSTPVFRQERIRPAICPSISESPRLQIYLSMHTPALQTQLLRHKNKCTIHEPRLRIMTFCKVTIVTKRIMALFRLCLKIMTCLEIMALFKNNSRLMVP